MLPIRIQFSLYDNILLDPMSLHLLGLQIVPLHLSCRAQHQISDLAPGLKRGFICVGINHKNMI
jgi:hypothetical protein